MTPQLLEDLAHRLPPGTTIIVVPPQNGEAPAIPVTQPFPAPDTQAGRLEALVREGDVPKTLAEWGRELKDVSTRELQRADEHEALETQIRERGLGHGAVEARPSRLLRYLQTCDAVTKGNMPAPAWWHSVRKGPNGRIHG